MYDVIVIGCGAAGMMAAYSASIQGNKVLIVEKNEKPGKKVYITGKGRCNITNACDIENLFQNVVTNPKFLYSSFYGFDNQSVISFFEEAGCPIKIERGQRVFPVSDHSSDVITALIYKLKQNGVEIQFSSPVINLLIDDHVVTGVVLKNGKKIIGNKVIIATGGESYPLTGSTGDGYSFAKDSGHCIVKTKPALVPLVSEEEWCRELMGLSLKNVELRLIFNGKEYFKDLGEMLFTHFGVSGPLVLSASSFYSKFLSNKKAELVIDLKPGLSEEQLDKRVLRDFKEQQNKQFRNSLGGLFPTRLIPIIISKSGISEYKRVNEITKDERKHFVTLIKNFKIHIVGTRGFSEAIITQGGVSTKDIDPSTMQSKIISNLFFAGEVIDLDALTGGFNLQIAWSTGYLAGQN